MFLAKYSCLGVYDEDLKKIFIIDNEEIQYLKSYGCNLIGISWEYDGLLTDSDLFYINYDILI